MFCFSLKLSLSHVVISSHGARFQPVREELAHHDFFIRLKSQPIDHAFQDLFRRGHTSLLHLRKAGRCQTP